MIILRHVAMGDIVEVWHFAVLVRAISGGWWPRNRGMDAMPQFRNGDFVGANTRDLNDAIVYLAAKYPEEFSL